MQNDDTFNPNVIEKLTSVHSELHQGAKDIVVFAMQNKTKPPVEKFDEFINRYEGFLIQLRRLEHECLHADSGMDSLTGLRSQKVMLHELGKEMERRSREGRPFSLALAQIDQYEYIKQLQTEEQFRASMEKIGSLILKCVRSFDDAYRASDSEFVMSLKHSNMSGGSAAINRLKIMMDEEGPSVTENEKTYPITMSYLVAEPVPGDSVESLIDNMRKDLLRYEEKGGTSLEYIEVSPLKRFLDAAEEEENSALNDSL